MLDEGEASPVVLTQRLGATLGTVAYHVRTLERLGLIEMVATRQRRGATEHVYAAREHPRISDRAWAATNPQAKHAVISAMLSQVGEFATQSAMAGGFERSEAHITRTAVKLDEKGWSMLAQATRKWLTEVARIEERSRQRARRSGEEELDAGLVVMLFQAPAREPSART